MKEKLISLRNKLEKYRNPLTAHHTGVYAAQAAYFFVLSLIPIMLLFVTMIQFTPVTRTEILLAVEQIFPSTVQEIIIHIMNQVYAQSGRIIPITIIVALWSAGRGVLSVTSGLNQIYQNTETRNYIYLRIRATLYTLLFLIVIILSLVVAVFGNSIHVFVHQHIPFLTQVADIMIQMRMIVTFIILAVFWTFVYKYLPNRKDKAGTTFRQQFPGAVFTACGWLLLSFIFSIYLDIFTGFSTMYGSLTTMMLLMLWLYFCMYVILLGGELNVLLYKKHDI